MKCNPLHWLWGLIPLALLAWFATQLEHARIENDLGQRVQEQLAGSGLKWSRSAFSARDGAITGQALDDADPGRAVDIARSVWGVRVVENKATLLDKVDTYTWGVVRAGNRVRLTGYVPSDATRATIVASAKTNFAGAEVVDEMKLARGAPQLDTWMSGVNFGMRQVAGLKAGDAKLDALALSVGGEAATVPTYRSVKSALAKELPRGLKLSDDRVTAPIVRPYVWSALSQSGQVSLSGFVPSERARDEILGAAKAAFPRATVTDRMEPGDGAVQGHVLAATESLKVLAQLESGNADIRDATVALAGMASSEQVANGVKSSVRAGTPKTFAVTDAVRFRDAGPKPVSPFTTAIAVDGDVVLLTGYAPSDAAKAALAQSVIARFPGRRIDNRLEVAAGAPDGWQRCIDAGLGGVARVGGGRLAMSDRRMDVSGATDDEALAAAISGDVRGASSTVCDATVRIDLRAEAIPDLVWRAVYSGNDVVLDGDVPSAAAKDSLLQSARRLFVGRQVADRMRVVETRTRLWQAVAEQGLTSLAELRKGEVALNRGVLSVSGEAGSQSVVGGVQARFAREIAKGYTGRSLITVAAAQPIPVPVAPPVAVVPSAPASVPAPRVQPVMPPPAPVVDLVAKRCEDSLRSAAREGTIRFERASATLARDSTLTLEKLGQAAKACPKVRIEIEGHTDNEGTPERNERLSDRRAQAVVDFLARAGVEPQKLFAVGYGETRPLVPNDSAVNRAKNRRIEFTVKAD
ncbi:MAG: OmpA family protein [Hyphomicrobiaceae bacterium]|nr:OmpA family protein [Hyphomicrobiaceae bacterium]